MLVRKPKIMRNGYYDNGDCVFGVDAFGILRFAQDDADEGMHFQLPVAGYRV